MNNILIKIKDLPSDLIIDILLYIDAFTAQKILDIIDDAQSEKYINDHLNKNAIKIQKMWKNNPKIPIDEDWDEFLNITFGILLRYYNKFYPTKYLISYPELCIKKISHLNPDILHTIPNIKNRKRSDCISWIRKNLTFEELINTGW